MTQSISYYSPDFCDSSIPVSFKGAQCIPHDAAYDIANEYGDKGHAEFMRLLLAEIESSSEKRGSFIFGNRTFAVCVVED